MDITKFCIYLANLSPRFGTGSGKVRPVVVIQTNLLNNTHPSTIVCPLATKVTREAKILRVNIMKKQAELKKASDILVDQIRAIDNRRFLKKVGRLTFNQSSKLLDSLRILLLE